MSKKNLIKWTVSFTVFLKFHNHVKTGVMKFIIIIRIIFEWTKAKAITSIYLSSNYD